MKLYRPSDHPNATMLWPLGAWPKGPMCMTELVDKAIAEESYNSATNAWTNADRAAVESYVMALVASGFVTESEVDISQLSQDIRAHLVELEPYGKIEGVWICPSLCVPMGMDDSQSPVGTIGGADVFIQSGGRRVGSWAVIVRGGRS